LKLIDALEIGLDCGLTTVGEAIFNIRIHCINLFNYDEIEEEIKKLEKDVETYWVHKDDLISDWIKKLNNKNV
jgi:hypothetical protein